MPIITAAQAPRFENDHASFIGLAAPSRGATENCAWRLILKPGVDAPPHALDREEIFVAVSGAMNVTIDGETHTVATGDALVVPAHQQFAMTNPHDEPFEAIVVLPVGGHGLLPGQPPITAPWMR
ncbi:cupin domain-containing protein [Nocardia brasiliensis]|uniref:Cupin domain-containing protein n=1 Tax=Nocardia brasiliensis TaxID=37326 RepID=A0A6G9XR09_NOCBR|nr:cupin domain-containing protein [Nocardia brasiliensis]QIS03354.1 cupin domain-containing protein [Nocardia brasiliensis]